VRQREVAASRIEQVEAKFLGQLLPEADTGVVEQHAFWGQVVGPDDGRVATGIAASQVPLFQNRHVGDTVLARQVVGGGQTVPAGTDDHHVVAGFEFARRRKHPRLRMLA